MTRPRSTAPAPPRRRADAERSVARILDAAVDALAGDPEVSLAEIARRAGVVRATIYVHFPTREALLEAVTHRAIAEVAAGGEAAAPHSGDPPRGARAGGPPGGRPPAGGRGGVGPAAQGSGAPAEALGRVVAASWRRLGRYHALVAINTQQHGHAALRHRHSSVLALLEPLIERGQADGSFRADVPAAW